MALADFLRTIDDEVKTVISPDFDVEIMETSFVPSFDDSDITYDRLEEKVKRCKLLESCVLYVDIRDSTNLSAAKQPRTLAKVYSSFVRSMIATARYYGGHVRNIIGDRVMVVFDKEDCFKNAVNTAILMNTVATHIIRKHLKKTFSFSCGIGIDYGKMLIAKAGAIRRGSETEFYRSLVWLGRPANIASRLTDMANKSYTEEKNVVNWANQYSEDGEWYWRDDSLEDFLSQLKPEYHFNPSITKLVHSSEYFTGFRVREMERTTKLSSILITEDVYKGFSQESPEDSSLKNNSWSIQNTDLVEYKGNVYGGDIVFTAYRDI